MSVSLTLGARPTIKVEVEDRRIELSAGSDFEGGYCATAKIERHSPRWGWSTSRGVHAANGKHARWVWFGIRGDRWVHGWRIAWWWPQRSVHFNEPEANSSANGGPS